MKKVIGIAIIILIGLGIHKINMLALEHDEQMEKATYYEDPGYWYTEWQKEN